MLVRFKRSWELPERLATPEPVYLERRRLVQAMGRAGGGKARKAAARPGKRAAKKPAKRKAAR